MKNTLFQFLILFSFCDAVEPLQLGAQDLTTTIIGILLVLSGLLVVCSNNAIESVLALIVCFILSAMLLLIFQADVLGLLFIIIYVGAIAVLFLFVIMMLNIKLKSEIVLSRFIFASILILLLSYFLIDYFDLNNFFVYGAYFEGYEYNMHPLSLIDSLNNIDVMGQVLFNYYFVCFLLAGLILLIALIGAIVLTLTFNDMEIGQLVNRQLSRTDNNLAFFNS